jgi:hypothetical protein
MTSSEWIDFKYFKEAQYKQQRVRIKEMCQQITDTKYLKVLNEPRKSSIPIVYDDKHMVGILSNTQGMLLNTWIFKIAHVPNGKSHSKNYNVQTCKAKNSKKVLCLRLLQQLGDIIF